MLNKKYLYTGIGVIILIIIVAVVFSKFSKNTESESKTEQINKAEIIDYKNIAYMIEGQSVLLKDNPDSNMSTVQYFGNDLVADIDGNGHNDVVFLVTNEAGGSGTFYYVVSALGTEDGYVGSDGYYLGDRIAPQNIEMSKDPRHKDVVVVNYAERAPGEPMTSQPSVGKSVYLKIDNKTNQWGIVANNFGD
jgi:hypothetical protein